MAHRRTARPCCCGCGPRRRTRARRLRPWRSGCCRGGTSPGGRGRGFGDPLGLEPALGVDGGLAAVRGGRDGLPVAMIMDVAGDEHAVDLGAGLVVDDEVALLVDVEPVLEG